MPPPGSRLIGLLSPDASDEALEAFVDELMRVAAEEDAKEHARQRADAERQAAKTVQD